MGHHQVQAPADTSFSAPKNAVMGAIGALVIGGALLAWGIVSDPWRGWANMLLASHYAAGVAVGGGVIMALYYVTNAGWWPVIKRIVEAFTTYLPIGLLTFLVIGFVGLHELYEWSHEDIVAKDHLLQHKQALLNPTSWLVGTAIVFGGWILLTWAMRRQTVLQDQDGDDNRTQVCVRLGAIFLVFYALSVTVSSLQWLMSLEPHWFSTMFGVYQFIGMFVATTATLVMFVLGMRKAGYLTYFNDAHMHDLGKMMFAFSTFWAYIWVGQYLLIWYSNIPEETGYYIHRNEGGWMLLFLLNPVINWAIPFLTLLPMPNKKNPKVLFLVAAILLVGHWLDLYLQVMPGTSHFAAHHHGADVHGPFFGPVEIGAVLALGGLFVLVVLKMLEKKPLLPKNDPYLVESLNFEPGPGPQGAGMPFSKRA